MNLISHGSNIISRKTMKECLKDWDVSNDTESDNYVVFQYYGGKT